MENKPKFQTPYPHYSPINTLFIGLIKLQAKKSNSLLILHEIHCMRKYVTIFFLAFTAAITSKAQQTESSKEKVWTLKECVDFALEENLAVKQSRVNNRLNEQNQLQSYGNLLPNLNGNATHIYNYGQTIDPYTNSFATDLVRSNNFRLGANWTLFNGMRNLNNVKKSELDLLAGKYNIKASEFDIVLQVTSAYLDVLFNKEQLKAALSQKEATQKQVGQSDKLFKAGNIPEGELLNVQSQLAQEELNIVDRENDLMLAELQLKQLLLLKADTPFEVSDPEDFDANELKMPGNRNYIVNQAIENFPGVKQREFELQSAEKEIQLARGGFMPTLSLSGSLATGYSGLRTEVVEVNQTGTQVIGSVEGTNQNVVAPQFEQTIRDQPFTTQLDDNLNRSFGFNLNVPIFNNFTNKVNVNRAKINHEITELALEREKLNVTREVETAYANATASFKRYKATEKAVTAAEKALEYAEKRFEVGMTNAVEFNMAKNNVIRTQTDLIRAKYELLFRLRILEFYQGDSEMF